MSIEDRLERFVAPWVRELVPYKIVDAGGLIKLDAMENPYSIPVELRESWNDLLSGVEPNRYPDPTASELKQSLLNSHDLPKSIQAALGNGSDELIHLLCLAFARGGSCVLCPEPTFVVYSNAARAVGMEFVGVSLDKSDFTLDLDATIAAIKEREPALVFIASPNNPTANRLDENTLEAICEFTPGLVVLDEAYYRFSGHTRVAEIQSTENLVVMQTLSKIGLAGIRVGVLFGAAPWIDLIERLRMPYNINALSQAAGKFAIEHESAFQMQITAIVEQREILFDDLRRLDGITVWPSATNFILFRAPRNRGTSVFDSLKQQGILIKNLSDSHPMLADCLRVTVGTKEENQAFLSALRSSLD